MRTSFSGFRKLAIAIGASLSVGMVCPAVAANGEVRTVYASAALSDLASASTLIDAWRDYALSSMRPDFAWASDGQDNSHEPSLFDRGRTRLATPASHFVGSSAINTSPLHVVFLTSRVAQDNSLFSGAATPRLLPDYSAGLHRYLIAPSLTQKLSDSSYVGVSAIFAYQRFGGFETGATTLAAPTSVADASITPPLLHGNDSSFGTGARMDFNSALNDRISWQTGYQTRVSMDALGSYHSLFFEPGTFDIPASANVGFGFAVTPQFKMDVGVERVMYDQIKPFVSDSLPPQFLALLGSGLSPRFVWQDLNVYSIGGSWHGENGDWTFRYSSREQPLPTSQLLQHALQADLSAHNMELGYARAFDSSSTLRLIATYAPVQAFVGAPLTYSLNNIYGGNQVQLEAQWITMF